MSHTEQIVHELHAEFESMLDYVKSSGHATADQVERGLFRRLLNLGARLMLLFFALRSEHAARDTHQKAKGIVLPYLAERRRQYFSIFGKLAFWRPYFYRPGAGGASPLDQDLALGDDCYSDLLCELAEYLGVGTTYAKVADCFSRLLGLDLSTQAISDMVAEDACDVEAFYRQKAAPPTASEASILVIQADGKGVPMVRQPAATRKLRLSKGDKHNRKKEAVVTGVYTIVPRMRTPADVIASLFHPAPKIVPSAQPRLEPQNKQLWATMAGKDAALGRLAKQAARRAGPHIEHRVALTDGAEALQERVQKHLPDFSLVLDFIHADEYLWDAANSLFGETSAQRTPWVEQQTLSLLAGRQVDIVSELRRLATLTDTKATQRKVLNQVANYFERNAPFMHYDQYLAQGWPIASGVIEGACRHLVKDRCELSGMRWTLKGVENLLRLRAVAVNNHWEDYQRFHQQQRYQRLYGVPMPQQDSIEAQVLEPTSIPVPENASTGRLFIMPVMVKPRTASAQQPAA
jgi:hypothetical protein